MIVIVIIIIALSALRLATLVWGGAARLGLVSVGNAGCFTVPRRRALPRPVPSAPAAAPLAAAAGRLPRRGGAFGLGGLVALCRWRPPAAVGLSWRRLPATASLRGPASPATEAAWHRRARRARQAARGVIAVANARALLAAHHGGGMGGARDGRGGSGAEGIKYMDWVCPMPNCKFRNYGSRPRCRECEAYPQGGTRTVKGAGKGAGGGQSAWAPGGIASRQLQLQEQARRDQQRALDKVRNENKREMDKLRKELADAKRTAAATGNSTTMDISSGDDDDDADDDAEQKEKQLAGEIKSLEELVKGLPASVLFRSTTQKRIDEAKEELRCIREQRGGPEAKVLGVAGKHQKELRATRAKLLKRSSAQQRIEGEVEDMENKVEEMQTRLKEKRAQLAKAKEDVQQAHDELQRLTKASAEGACPERAGGGAKTTDTGHTTAAALVDQLKTLLPPSAMGEQLAEVLDAAIKHQKQQFEEQQLQQRQQEEAAEAAAKAAAVQAQAAAAATAAAAAQHRQKTSGANEGDDGDDGDYDDQMADLAGSTLDLLDTMLEAADQAVTNEQAAEGAGGPTIGEANTHRAKLVAHLKKRGATPGRLQGVIKELKNKPRASANAATAAAAAAAAAAAKPASSAT